MDKKNAIVLTVIAVATLLVTIVGATFAYFSAQAGSGGNADIVVQTSTSDSLEYGSFEPITIIANLSNFGKDMGNVSGTSTGAVTIKAGEGDSDVTYCYTVALNVTKNNLTYTTAEKTPELTLTVSKEGTPLITNQDITTAAVGESIVRIPTTVGGTDYVHRITATPGTTESDNWSATATLVNLGTDQNENTFKTFVGMLKFQPVDCA